MSIERFRRAVNKALYDHGEWVLSARYYRLPEEACEHLANASIASEKAVVAIYEAALSAGPPPDAPRWREFFGNVWNAVREGYSLDGGELQDWAEETGLLVRVQRIAPCGEGCVCAEFDADGPTDCYMPFDSPELAALRASPPIPQRTP